MCTVQPTIVWHKSTVTAVVLETAAFQVRLEFVLHVMQVAPAGVPARSPRLRVGNSLYVWEEAICRLRAGACARRGALAQSARRYSAAISS